MVYVYLIGGLFNIKLSIGPEGSGPGLDNLRLSRIFLQDYVGPDFRKEIIKEFHPKANFILMHLNEGNELDYPTKDSETVLTMKDPLRTAPTLDSTMRQVTIFVHEATRYGTLPHQYASWSPGWFPDILVMLDMVKQHVVPPCKVVVSLNSDPVAPNDLESLKEYVDGHVRRLEQGGFEVSVIRDGSWSNIHYRKLPWRHQ